MAHQFPGFSKDLFSFLTDLAAHNDRDWFQANKARYRREVADPVMGFIEAMGEVLPDISEAFVADPRPNGGSMFRIYRDTRFSKDKRPYKENVGCQFRHQAGRDAHGPGFYLHLEPGNVFLGAGMWRPPNPTLNQVRTAIVEDPVGWSEVILDTAFRDYFGDFDGESLKRPPRGFDPEHPHLTDLKRKSFVVFHDLTEADVQDSGVITRAADAFNRAAPLMRFLTGALGLPY